MTPYELVRNQCILSGHAFLETERGYHLSEANDGIDIPRIVVLPLESGRRDDDLTGSLVVVTFMGEELGGVSVLNVTPTHRAWDLYKALCAQQDLIDAYAMGEGVYADYAEALVKNLEEAAANAKAISVESSPTGCTEGGCTL